MNNNKKKVVVVGGGFGGLKAAKALGGRKDVDVLLIDRRNYHLFQPLLYQVATAGLSPAEISAPIRSILSRFKNISVYLDNIERVDAINNKVIAPDLEASYDYLVLACGAKHSYFGHGDWEEFAPGLKTLEQATEIRRRILLAFERAEKETNSELRKQHLTFVIVGGGPTGVELAGAIAEISRQTLARDFRHIDPTNTRVLLIEAGDRVLASFDPELSRSAARDLEDLGVQIWTHTRVTEVSEGQVVMGGEVIKASTILWAAGVQPSSLNKTLPAELDRTGRVVVDKDLSLKSHPNIFVIGDQAAFMDKNGKALPGLASVAMQQGVHVAKVILDDIKGKPRPEFEYFDKGQMATIGKRKAIAEVGHFKFRGFFAWLVWLLIHIYYLIGFKNRFFVLWQWTYAYLTFRRGARLIIDKEWRSEKRG